VADASPSSSIRKPTVRIVASTGRSAPQGAPFPFRAIITNTSPLPISADVSLSLAPSGKGHPVPFSHRIVLVPGSSKTTVNATVTSSQWFSQRGPFHVEAMVHLLDGGAVEGDPLTYTVTPSPITAPTFQDVTASAGLSTTIPDGNCGHFTNGAAWADVNGDGYLDLFVTRGNLPPQLFINDGHGHFTDEAAARGIDNGGQWASGAVFADFNNDGYPDLYIANDGASRLYKNDGTGHFTDVAQAAGVANNLDASSASWGDYDNDGNLDLYVTNYATCNNLGQNFQYQPDHLYHNNGDGTFTDVTSLLGPDPGKTTGAGFEAAWFDYNGDGRQDLYLANDYLGPAPDANHLWRNDGPDGSGGWKFTDVSTPSGTAYAMNTMGIGVGDYNRDGRLDLALSNIDENRLLRNNGNGTFTDVAGPAGVSRPDQRVDQRSITWGATFADLNLDGWEDLYFAAGYLNPYYAPGTDGPQHNELYVNEGNGKFLDLSAPSLADDPGQSRGVALADYDRDGRMDMFVVDQSGSPHLYRNVTPIGNDHWLEVNTVGTTSNRDGCGARLTLTAGGATMIGEVFCGSTSVSSGSDSVVHFGLGTAKQVSKLVIQWPSGKRQELQNLAPDRLITVTEPS
jgi:hypothetical protein